MVSKSETLLLDDSLRELPFSDDSFSCLFLVWFPNSYTVELENQTSLFLLHINTAKVIRTNISPDYLGHGGRNLAGVFTAGVYILLFTVSN